MLMTPFKKKSSSSFILGGRGCKIGVSFVSHINGIYLFNAFVLR